MPVESVQAYTATKARDIEVEDTGVMSLRWRSGAPSSVNLAILTYPKDMEGSISILGEKGSVRIGGVAVNEIQHCQFSEPHEMEAQVKSASYETTSVYGHRHPLYYENVVKTRRGEAEPEANGREGLRSPELLIASDQSARDGRPVCLPLEL